MKHFFTKSVLCVRKPHALSCVLFLCLVLMLNISKAQNPLASAQDFNIFTEGNLTINAGDIEGAIAVGGNLVIQGNCNRTSSNATGKQSYVTIGGIKYAVLVGGGLSGVNGGKLFTIDGKAGATDDHFVRFNTLSGSTTITNSGGIDIGSPATNNLNRYIRINSTSQATSTIENTASLINFAAAFADFRSKSNAMGLKVGNVTPTVSGGQATLNLGNNTNNVWNISGTTLNSYNQINLTGILPSATNPLVINVNATGTYNWSNLKFIIAGESDNFIEVNRAPYIIWNFYNNISALNILNSNLLIGSILAPDANITNNGSGNITGQVIARTYTKPWAGELHIAKFSANISLGVLAAQEINIAPVLNNNIVTVNWQTINENNTSYFEVERSYNNNSFETIYRAYTFVANGGNGTYHFNDNTFANTSNTLFYRIKMVDQNGRATYSKTATVKIAQQTQITVWPNPFVSTVSFTYTALQTSALNVRLLDVSGKQIKTGQYTVSKGTNSLSFTDIPASIAPGLYLLEITNVNDSQKQILRLMK
ncbi:MAG: choice-of-anchor A family protein [Chitinophagaceae bacterium]|nr:choice-of-anchor A family protein [Chitinophagaceae bacterium]